MELNIINSLIQRIEILENKISELESKRNESYYQKFLEKKLDGKHKKSKHGVSDIETNDEIIEIKHWKNYKNCMGQLLSYNTTNKKKLSGYFFGDTTDEYIQN